MDKLRFMDSLKAAEKNGPLASQDTLWHDVARRYNTGDGLSVQFREKPKIEITKSIVYHFVSRNGIAVKTPKRKLGRPLGGRTIHGKDTYKEIIKRVLDYLQDEAVDQKWTTKNVRDWSIVNDTRRILGMPLVEPINNPTLEHFR